MIFISYCPEVHELWPAPSTMRFILKQHNIYDTLRNTFDT